MTMFTTTTAPLDGTALWNFLAGMAERRRAATAQLREAADWLDAHPTFATEWEGPRAFTFTLGHFVRHSWLLSEAERAEAARRVLRDGGRLLASRQPIGTVRKETTDSSYQLHLPLPSGVSLTIFASRDQVCDTVETGEVEQVEVLEIPPEVADRYKVPADVLAQYEMPDEVRDQYRRVATKPKVERRCRTLLTLEEFETAPAEEVES